MNRSSNDTENASMISTQTNRQPQTSSDRPTPIRRLGTEADRTIIGGKGAALDLLVRHGLPVPEGFVIVADALSSALADAGRSLDDPGDFADSFPVPDSLLDAVMQQLQQMNRTTVAIRSSAIDEDGFNSSFAGQYESVLNVPADNREKIADAIGRVWSSLFSDHATTYRRSKGGENNSPPGIAVVVQSMVDADLSGVLFSVDPVGRDRNLMVLNVVHGLGDKLVSGEVTPEEYRIERSDEAKRPPVEDSLLDATTLSQLRDLALRIEEIGGGPQDIEFAMQDGAISILQARPITTLAPKVDGTDRLDDVPPVPVETIVPEEGFWELSSKDFQRPVTPLTTDIYYPIIEGSIGAFFREFGIMLDGMETRNIGGHPYVRMIPPGGKEGAPPPAFLMKILFRVVPFLRAKRKAARRATEENLAETYVKRWYAEERTELLDQLARFSKLDRAAETDEDLLVLLEQIRDWLRVALDAHFMTLPSHILAVSDLYLFAERHLGWSNEKIGHMISGISDETSAGAGILGRMAQLATKRLEGQSIDITGLEELCTTDDMFDRLYHEYIERCGLMLRGYDFDSPVTAENRTAVLEQVSAYVVSGYDPDRVAEELGKQRQELERKAKEIARNISEKRVEELQQIFIALRTGMPIRDDTGLVALRAMGAIRLVVVELGRRLVDRSLVERAAHVVYLSANEIAESVRVGTDRMDLITRRRGERKWAEMNPGPSSFGKDPGDPPPVELLPKEMRRIMGGLMWIIKNDLDPPIPPDEEGGINGIAASPGEVTGRVRILRDISVLDEIQPGEIIVCPITTPAWAEIFPIIGGIISDFGGILSHPAIIAREFGIPAIVGAGSATTTLKNGDLVRLDGTTGRVEILE